MPLYLFSLLLHAYLAVRLLRDRALYAHAVQSATYQAAARP